MSYKEDTKGFGFLLLLIVIFLIVLGVVGLGLRSFLAPAHEAIDREVYDQSRAYQQGMAVELDDLCRQRKLSSDEMVRATLADTIRLRSARFKGELPTHIEACLNEVR